MITWNLPATSVSHVNRKMSILIGHAKNLVLKLQENAGFVPGATAAPINF